MDRAHGCALVFPLLPSKMNYFAAETQAFNLAVMQHTILLYVFSIIYNYLSFSRSNFKYSYRSVTREHLYDGVFSAAEE